ncbi:MAG TPA: hypothetical protein VMZ06_13185, partial [Candidatus Bathyarchaeia archaeon]|nr:hypothetical protein [Candidatus Bathyarchaeia archaeon]
AAAFIGMSMSFLRMARCEGHRGNRTPGPPFYRIGKVVRYSITDLRAWLEARRCETGAAIEFLNADTERTVKNGTKTTEH